MPISRSEAEQHVISKAVKDKDFRERLIEDPRGVLEEELGAKLPEALNIHVNRESPTDIYLTLPHEGKGLTQKSTGESGELSEEQLSGVSGGWDTSAKNRGDWDGVVIGK